jgi:hypothetical protein
MANTVTAKLKAVEVRVRGDLIDLGVLSDEYVVVTELTVEQAKKLEQILRRARKEISNAS